MKPLKIFIAGPYGDPTSLKSVKAGSSEAVAPVTKEQIRANIAKADEIGRQLALKGHSPLIPHKMLQGWEDDPRFETEDFIKIDLDWLCQADALFYIGPSKGADRN